MKAIDRRPRRLESRLTPPDNLEDQRAESSLRELIRRRCEKTGHPYVDLSPEFVGLSLTEIARARLHKMHEGQGNHPLRRLVASQQRRADAGEGEAGVANVPGTHPGNYRYVLTPS